MRYTANINVQVEPEQRELIDELVRLSTCETRSQFMRQLLGRLSAIARRGEPFDVKELQLSQRNGRAK